LRLSVQLDANPERACRHLCDQLWRRERREFNEVDTVSERSRQTAAEFKGEASLSHSTRTNQRYASSGPQ
jgi:hypothetical protein